MKLSKSYEKLSRPEKTKRIDSEIENIEIRIKELIQIRKNETYRYQNAKM